eukprot:EG_transcript_9090
MPSSTNRHRVPVPMVSDGWRLHCRGYAAPLTVPLVTSRKRHKSQWQALCTVSAVALSVAFVCSPIGAHTSAWLRNLPRLAALPGLEGAEHFHSIPRSALSEKKLEEDGLAEEEPKQAEMHFWGAMDTTLPQRQYWLKQWSLPGTKWVLSGHSRAMERTGFHLRGGSGHIMLDAGIDLPSPHSTPPRMVLLTHAHSDHANALPMILRKKHLVPGTWKSTHVFLPLTIMRRVREYCLLSKALHHDERAVPHPVPGKRLHAPDIMPGAALCSSALEGSYRLWRPVVPGMRVPILMGNTAGSREVMEVAVVRCDHTVPTCGYVLLERRRKLKPEYVRETKRLTEANVVAAKRRGETVDAVVRTPLLAFLLDTTTEVLEHSDEQSDLIFSCPVIMIECTYLEQDMEDEARTRRHTMWPDLLPFVRHSISEAATKGTDPPTWVLIHFSLRYEEADVVAFFEAMADLGPRLPPQPRPPNLVLWLDTRVVELWYPN